MPRVLLPCLPDWEISPDGRSLPVCSRLAPGLGAIRDALSTRVLVVLGVTPAGRELPPELKNRQRSRSMMACVG